MPLFEAHSQILYFTNRAKLYFHVYYMFIFDVEHVRIDLTYNFGEKLTFSTEWVKKECKTTKYLF